jgi:formylglycine-generating enzyme required for sulfatase activity
VILYEFLTGYRPFQGDRAKLTRDHCSTKPPWFAEVNPRVDLPAVERVVRRCLEKDPADRPRSAPELFELFRAAALKTGYSPPPGPHEHERENERLTSADVPRRPPSRLMARLATISFATFVCVVLTLVAPRPSRVRPPGPPPVDPKVIEIVPTTSAVAPARAVPAPMPPGLIEFLNDHELRPVAGAGIAPGGYPKIVEAGAERRRLVWHPGAYLPADHEPGPDQAKLGMLPTVLVRKDGTRFLLIEGGEFVMGAFDDRISDFYAEEKPGHHVALTSFYIQSTEVTFGEFERFRKETARDRNDPDLREGYAYAWSALATKMNEEEVRTHPAVGVTRKLAEAYARHVGGELPSEAQWEFAARSGGKNQLHVWGDQPQFPDHVNINNPIVVGIETRPVGLSTRDRTAQGVLDLTGNVREWCRDVWKAYPQVEPARDPVERAASDDINPLFVIRGGSYDTDRETARVTWRSDLPGKAYRMKENDYDLDLGFRVVLDVVALPAHLVAQPAAATGPAPAGEGGR